MGFNSLMSSQFRCNMTSVLLKFTTPCRTTQWKQQVVNHLKIYRNTIINMVHYLERDLKFASQEWVSEGLQLWQVVEGDISEAGWKAVVLDVGVCVYHNSHSKPRCLVDGRGICMCVIMDSYIAHFSYVQISTFPRVSCDQTHTRSAQVIP